MSNVASVVNHFPTANEGFTTTITGTVIGGTTTTVPLLSVAGLTNGSIFVGIIAPNTASMDVFTGTVSTGTSSITGVKWTRGANATHNAGTGIVDYITGTALNMIAKGLLVAHNQDGTHKTSLTLTTPTIASFTNATHNHTNTAGGGTLTPAAMADRTRRVHMFLAADGTGGTTLTQLEASDVTFTGTPSTYARLNCILPMDWTSGTTATVKLVFYSTSANNQALNYYLGAHASGSTFSSWNIQNNIVTGSTIGVVANTIATFSLYTIAAASLSAGVPITVAVKPNSAVTGNLILTHAYLEYTADM